MKENIRNLLKKAGIAAGITTAVAGGVAGANAETPKATTSDLNKEKTKSVLPNAHEEYDAKTINIETNGDPTDTIKIILKSFLLKKERGIYAIKSANELGIQGPPVLPPNTEIVQRISLAERYRHKGQFFIWDGGQSNNYFCIKLFLIGEEDMILAVDRDGYCYADSWIDGSGNKTPLCLNRVIVDFEPSPKADHHHDYHHDRPSPSPDRNQTQEQLVTIRFTKYRVTYWYGVKKTTEKLITWTEKVPINEAKGWFAAPVFPSYEPSYGNGSFEYVDWKQER